GSTHSMQPGALMEVRSIGSWIEPQVCSLLPRTGKAGFVAPALLSSSCNGEPSFGQVPAASPVAGVVVAELAHPKPRPTKLPLPSRKPNFDPLVPTLPVAGWATGQLSR